MSEALMSEHSGGFRGFGLIGFIGFRIYRGLEFRGLGFVGV